ncbi:MAG: HEAT repeat domain-containing protein [Acidobacteriota bacterium]
MRKTTRIVLICCVALALVSCAGSDGEEAERAGAGPTPARDAAGESTAVFSGRPAREWIEQLLESDEPKERLEAASALAKMGPEVSGSTDALIVALGDQSSLVRTAATAALQRFGRDTLAKLYPAVRGNQNPRVRAGSAVAISQIGAADPRTMPALIAALEDPSGLVRRIVTQVISIFGARAGEAVPALIKTLGDEDVEVRVAAATTLGIIGPAAEAAGPALRRVLQDSDENVRGAARTALRNIER